MYICFVLDILQLGKLIFNFQECELTRYPFNNNYKLINRISILRNNRWICDPDLTKPHTHTMLRFCNLKSRSRIRSAFLEVHNLSPAETEVLMFEHILFEYREGFYWNKGCQRKIALPIREPCKENNSPGCALNKFRELRGSYTWSRRYPLWYMDKEAQLICIHSPFSKRFEMSVLEN